MTVKRSFEALDAWMHGEPWHAKHCDKCGRETLEFDYVDADEIVMWCTADGCAYTDVFERDDFPGKDEPKSSGHAGKAKPNGHDKSGDDHWQDRAAGDIPRMAKTRNATASAIASEMDNDPALDGAYGMDLFSRMPYLMRPIPRRDRQAPDHFKPRPLRDSDITQLILYFEERGFKKVAKGVVIDAINLAAEDNPVFALRDRLASLKWDGVPRLDRFLIDHAGVAPEVEEDDADAEAARDELLIYACAVTRCFFISAVARIFRPGCKVDTCLVLEGAQGAFKSSLFRVMALEDDYFSDSMPQDFSTKDARQHLAGKWIIELGEIAHLRKSRIESTKAFLSCQTDRFRPSYGRYETQWPRTCVFVASTNESEYLTDDTGNRRFWPLQCHNIDLDGAASVITQVWAEAVTAFRAGEPWWLEAKVEDIARHIQSEREEIDPWLEVLPDKITLLFTDTFTMDTVLNWLDIPKDRRDKAMTTRAGKVLAKLGCKREQYRPGPHQKLQRRYRKPEGFEP